MGKNYLPLIVLVTDGASVMVGKHTGVTARIKSCQPILTSIHCLCHCLALAATQAGNEVTYIAYKFKPTLTQLLYFYENSTVHTSGLKAIQELLEITKFKLHQPAETHWLYIT